VFGDPETACTFMAAPNFYLNYTSPDALIASSPQEGAARVEELLNAIEYDVYL